MKGMRRWCPAVCISSCLSLISILWGNLARLCRLNRCVSLGEKSRLFSFFLLFRNGIRLDPSVWMCLVSGSEVDITTVYANWLASRRSKRQAHSFSIFLLHICIIDSQHPLLHYLLHFFCHLLNKSCKKSKGKMFCGLQFEKRSRQMVVKFLFLI